MAVVKLHGFPETELKVASCNRVSTRIEVRTSSELHLMPVFENLGTFFRASQSTLGDASHTGVLLAHSYIYIVCQGADSALIVAFKILGSP